MTAKKPPKPKAAKSRPLKWRCEFTCGFERVKKGGTPTEAQIKYLKGLKLDLSKYVV